MHKYRIHYLSEIDHSWPRQYESHAPVSVGDVIQVENGLYHHVRSVETQESGMCLSLAQSAMSKKNARHMPPW